MNTYDQATQKDKTHTHTHIRTHTHSTKALCCVCNMATAFAQPSDTCMCVRVCVYVWFTNVPLGRSLSNTNHHGTPACCRVEATLTLHLFPIGITLYQCYSQVASGVKGLINHVQDRGVEDRWWWSVRAGTHQGVVISAPRCGRSQPNER